MTICAFVAIIIYSNFCWTTLVFILGCSSNNDKSSRYAGQGDSFIEWVSTGSIVQYRQSQLSISLPGTGITISNQPAWHIPYRWSTTSSCSPPYNLISHSSTSQTTYTSCSGPRLNVKGDNVKAIPRGYKYRRGGTTILTTTPWEVCGWIW